MWVDISYFVIDDLHIYIYRWPSMKWMKIAFSSTPFFLHRRPMERKKIFWIFK